MALVYWGIDWESWPPTDAAEVLVKPTVLVTTQERRPGVLSQRDVWTSPNYVTRDW